MIATNGFLTAQECTKFVFGPRTPLGELTTLPRPPSRLGRGYPLPIPHPLDAFGVSVSSPTPAVLIPPNAWGLDKTLVIVADKL